MAQQQTLKQLLESLGFDDDLLKVLEQNLIKTPKALSHLSKDGLKRIIPQGAAEALYNSLHSAATNNNNNNAGQLVVFDKKTMELENKLELFKLQTENAQAVMQQKYQTEIDLLKQQAAHNKKEADLNLEIALLKQKLELQKPGPLPLRSSDFVLLMKAGAGSALFEYNSIYWTTANLYNHIDLTQNFCDAKYEAFNSARINRLRIVSLNGHAVELQLPYPTTLLEFFQSNSCAALTVVSGGSPTNVVNGTNFTFYDPQWRLNSKSTINNMGVRIGGHYHATWNGGYGNDTAGHACSAETAGIGIYDGQWPPFVHAKKSFGIRSAHDNMTNGSNVNTGFLLFGKYV